MLISKEVEVAVNPENIERLESLGYEIPRYYNKNRKKMVYKKGTKILVKIEDLTRTAPSIVNVKCDYCLTPKSVTYRDYNRSVNAHEVIKKYCCDNCDGLKKREIIEYKQSQCLLKQGDKGYWLFKENRMKAVDEYIKKHGTIVGMQNNKEGANLRTLIREYGDNIEDYCIELGYKLEDIKTYHRAEGYFDDLNNIVTELNKMVEMLGRFPKQQEVLKYLHINNNYLLKHGGIRAIKHLMGFNESEDLIDDRGFQNSSVYEYIVAQYLISNDIPYKREQNPFNGKHKRLRSDFTMYLKNGEEIHVEVWGFPKTNKNGSRESSYNKKRELKERLYNSSEHIFIGIDYEVFQLKYELIQEKLFEIFSPYIQLKFKYVEQSAIIPSNKLTDDELLNEILKYSDDPNILPKQSTLQENGVSYLFKEVLKRYGTFFNFAKKYEKSTHYQINKWDKESVFEVFEYMIDTYGHTLKNNEIKDNVRDKRLTGILENVKRLFGGLPDAKLSFFVYLVNNNRHLPKEDIEYLDGLIHKKRGFNANTCTPERIELAKMILEKNINITTISLHKHI